MKYLDDNRRKLQGQQPGQVQSQQVQNGLKAQPAVQTTAAPAPMEKQNIAQRPVEQQSTAPTPVQPRNQSATQNAASGAADQAQQLLSQQPGAYQSKWGSTIEDVLEQLLNPKEFTYDPNTDPLYLQMRDQYAQDGKMAMEDTMGITAQLTGGYGNSHAQMLGQQAYQGYMQGVNDMVPELRQQARAEYDAQNDLLVQQLGLLMDQDNQDYGRWQDEINRQYQLERDALSDQRYDQEWQYQKDRDALADSRYEDELAYSREQDALANERYDREWEYQLGRDQISDQRYDREWEYQVGRDQVADQRYQDELAYGREQDAYGRQQDSYDRLLELIIATGYQPSAEELAAAGMTEAQARAWRGYYTGSQSSGGSSGSGGTGGENITSQKPDDKSADDGKPTEQYRVQTPQQLGDPLKREDYVTIYANCAKYAGNGAPTSQLAAYIKQALNSGSITQEQYKKLMAQFGSLADPDKGSTGKGSSSSGSAGGKGSGVNNRYNTFN